MKRGIIYLFYTLSLISLVSAYQNSLYSNVELPVIGFFFLILFTLIKYSLTKGNLITDGSTRTILSFSTAGIATYYMMKSGFSFLDFFSSLGLADFILDSAPIAIIILLVIMMIIWGFGTVIMAIGGAIILFGAIGGLIEKVYNWEVAIATGIIVFLIGLFFNRKYYKKIGSGLGSLGRGIGRLGGMLGRIKLKKRNIFKNTKRLEEAIRKLKKKHGKLYRHNPLDSTLKDTEDRIRKLEEDRNRLIQEEQNLEQQEKQETKRIERERLNIQTQYNQYSNRIQQIMQKWNRRIPSAGSPNPEERRDSEEYSRLSRAMKRLRKIANANNINLN
jgi:hypothetical protein